MDRQLFGRCARQGDPGSTEAIVSVEDDLFQRFAPAAHQVLLGRSVPARLANEHVVRRYVTWLQDRAERHYRQQRVMTQKRDAEWVKSLAFVGKSRR
ncbi:hypothetical protein XarbCFBP7408_19585 [Xanthomonas arboricola pv. guizotiae]|uniref:SecA family profile domain-containing protein n=1 Tax=Xanthomonas arboricola pv. guizotiae TaxID=487867 RepID=A0A2S6ZU75_9XANT|nr:hypothetical protein [Xanthomonas arboricola]PPT95927.1 hypothetical protein XarbCFBP7409_16715 [Xanthomonas arboricola pv. guizotiae]PPU19132.1 hypothetical protein XarbCFBP7408_19585 [Xanthomonas arboricola pv. guizotiae]